MIALIAVWRTTACIIASSVGVQHTESGTTAGGQDKRPGARGGYGVVVVRFFARRTTIDSAMHAACALFLLLFRRATGPTWAFSP
jgi:hypothetical protein